MRKIAVFLFTACFGFEVLAKEEVVIHVDAGYAPMSYADKNGKAAGYYIEILQEANNRLKNFSLKLVPVPWKRGKELMNQGEGFALTPAFYHGHDWDYLYPYSIKYENENVYAYCQEKVLKSSSAKSWPKDFAGLKIGNISGFDGWGGEEFRKMVREKKIKYSESKTSEMNIKKLAGGRQVLTQTLHLDSLILFRASKEQEQA